MSEIVSIYESIGRNLGDILAKGTATQCTPTAFQSSVLINRDPAQFNGKDVYFYSGAGAGQARAIASFDVSNRRVIVEQAYTTTPSTNTSFIIFKEFMTEDYESAMNRAIGKAKLLALQEMAGTLSLVGTQYDYPVPSGLEYIENLKLVPTSGSDSASIDAIRRVSELAPRFFDIIGNVGGSRLISFDPRKISMSNYDKLICLVEGQSKYDFTGTQVNSDVQEYVIAYSSMMLAGQKDGTEWQRRFYMFRDEVKGRAEDIGLEATITRYGRGRKVN